MSDANTATITILAARAAPARKALEKVAKKAVRYGVPFEFKLGETYEETRERRSDLHPSGYVKYVVRLRDVTVTTDTPVVGDYEFLASVELTPAGNYVDTVPGVELPPEYRTTDNRCEHCQASRARKHVYVARNVETGELTQVGRTCLRDFLGTDTPEKVVNRFTFFRQLKGLDEEEGWGDGFRGSYWADDLQHILAVALVSVRL